MTNFHRKQTTHHVICNTEGIYEIGKGFVGGREAKSQWVEYFKSISPVNWSVAVEYDGDIIFLVSTIGGGCIDPLGFNFAFNCDSDINFDTITKELPKIFGTIVARLGGTAHFEID